ncbi:MAG: hypothetical protein JW817_04360 [Clostridiales bacterium]|nr:hypothetical protein [Clostridiales bacterium]
MKKIAVLVLVGLFTIAASGCFSAQKDTLEDLGIDVEDVIEEATNEDSEFVEMDDSMYDYQGPLYNFTATSGAKQIEAPSWDDFPADVILPGGVINSMLSGVWGNTEEEAKYFLVIETGKASYSDIAVWYRQELENNGWEIDAFVENENYASKKITASKGNITLEDIVFMPQDALDDGWDESAPIDEYGENDGNVAMSGMIIVTK